MRIVYLNPNRVRKFDKPFNVRLQNALIQVEKKFIAKERDFVIDITLITFLFQIVNNKMLDTSKYKERGFGLFLYFNESSTFDKEALTRFEGEEYFKEFECVSINDIPFFQLDLGTNKPRIIELVNKLIIDVYEVDLGAISVDVFEL